MNKEKKSLVTVTIKDSAGLNFSYTIKGEGELKIGSEGNTKGFITIKVENDKN